MQSDAETLRLIAAASNEAARNVRTAVIAELRAWLRKERFEYRPGSAYVVYADDVDGLLDAMEAEHA